MGERHLIRKIILMFQGSGGAHRSVRRIYDMYYHHHQHPFHTIFCPAIIKPFLICTVKRCNPLSSIRISAFRVLISPQPVYRLFRIFRAPLSSQPRNHCSNNLEYRVVPRSFTLNPVPFRSMAGFPFQSKKRGLIPLSDETCLHLHLHNHNLPDCFGVGGECGLVRYRALPPI
jgi:hypothetical protein